MKRISTSLPTELCRTREWDHTRNLQLADPDFWKPGAIDVLIGADHYKDVIKAELIHGREHEPLAQLSTFGWLLIGPYTSTSHKAGSYHTHQVTDFSQMQELLSRFWVQEEAPSSACAKLSKEEQECEEHYATTHKRMQDGSYEVRLPLIKAAHHLGESFNRAHSCLRGILSRCEKDQVLKERYIAFMKEYADLGHMVPVPQEDVETTPAYYLPHHGVIREDSKTTKLRVVFNGSASSSSGTSLNDLMHIGPNLSPNIVDVLTWIRTHLFTFATDITKMYRQIKVNQQDWNLQRILWVNEHQEVTPFYLTTVTYGTRSAPYLAIKTLFQLVADEGSKYPLAVDSITKGRYVDDIFGGASSEKELIEKANQLINLCKAGGFPLAKWSSNSLELLRKVTKESDSDTTISLDDCETKVLGLKWLPKSDELTFTFSLLHESTKVISKRSILSVVAQLFDPLGLVSPVVIKAKILLQDLWLLKLSWDDSVPASTQRKWHALKEDLQRLSSISIPRWLGVTETSVIDLHGFSDASQHAMAAVVYIITTEASHINSRLIMSKTKVAPLKRVSIPRLELGAAVLLTKLIKHLCDNSQLRIRSIHLWTDAKVALTWIQSHPSKWKDYVSNRVSFIQESLPTGQWRHVPGKENPADCASRGITTQQLQEHSLWWKGPHWLTSDPSAWPSQPAEMKESELPEAKAKAALVASTQHQLWDLSNRYSSFTRLLRITAWIMLACRKFKTRGTHQHTSISVDSIKEAKVFWIKELQKSSLAEEINLIRKSAVPRHHLLNRLTAFIDHEGILRVGGRLRNTQLEFHQRHPAIIPRVSHITTLIIRQAHQSTLHGGTQLTLGHTRQEFWIIGGRAPVRSYILRCVVCTRYRTQRAQQLMGQLPKARVTPSQPFNHCGIDYAGPVTVTSWKGRGSKSYKCWICIFVCFSTSAVHLELVSDYSTEGFLSAFRRFTSRRGIPSHLYSDCGTNFIGADKELKNLFASSKGQRSPLYQGITSQGVSWTFNPPAAPHMGGKWEAAVKSVKHHLRRTIGETKLTFEEYTTLLYQIEAVLNSRPMAPLTEDPEDLNIITPGHFLIGKPITAVPEPDLLNTQLTPTKRWLLIQQISQQFWKAWSTQHLQRLQSISKWHSPFNNIKIGSMVLLSDERSPPGTWPLARVIDIHPGKDGLTRIVTLKTATTQLTRPIHKLILLHSTDDSPEPESKGDGQQQADGGENVA